MHALFPYLCVKGCKIQFAYVSEIRASVSAQSTGGCSVFRLALSHVCSVQWRLPGGSECTPPLAYAAVPLPAAADGWLGLPVATCEYMINDPIGPNVIILALTVTQRTKSRPDWTLRKQQEAVNSSKKIAYFYHITIAPGFHSLKCFRVWKIGCVRMAKWSHEPSSRRKSNYTIKYQRQYS